MTRRFSLLFPIGVGALALQLFGAATLAASVDAPSAGSASEFHAVVMAALQQRGEPLWVTRPRWTQTPTGDDLWDTYPHEARNRGIAGLGVITCRVDGKGELGPCDVQRETPEGLGFGAAALRVSLKFRMKPVDESGIAVEGRLITVPIRYRF